MTFSRLIYLVRHGDIGLARKEKHFIGQLDLPLSEEGIEQAIRLRGELAGASLSAIYCSDLSRSVETARIIAEPHGLTPEARSDLRELCLGEWEGLTFDEVRGLYPKQFQDRGRDIVHYRPPGGESFLDCSLRVVAVFHQILQSKPGDVLISAHAGVIRLLVCHVLGIPLEGLLKIGQDPGSLSVLRIGQSGFRLERLNVVPAVCIPIRPGNPETVGPAVQQETSQ